MSSDGAKAIPDPATHPATAPQARGVLYAVVCGAGPAFTAARLVRYAVAEGWDVRVIATPVVVEYFVDPGELAQLSGNPVRTGFRRPGAPGSLPPADAAVVAPATYNTINKWAAGIADTFALSTLAELTGARVPVAVLPFVNTSFAANAVYGRSVAALRAEGVRMLVGSEGFAPYPPAEGDTAAEHFPWHLAVDAVADARP